MNRTALAAAASIFAVSCSSSDWTEQVYHDAQWQTDSSYALVMTVCKFTQAVSAVWSYMPVNPLSETVSLHYRTLGDTVSLRTVSSQFSNAVENPGIADGEPCLRGEYLAGKGKSFKYQLSGGEYKRTGSVNFSSESVTRSGKFVSRGITYDIETLAPLDTVPREFYKCSAYIDDIKGFYVMVTYEKNRYFLVDYRKYTINDSIFDTVSTGGSKFTGTDPKFQFAYFEHDSVIDLVPFDSLYTKNLTPRYTVKNRGGRYSFNLKTEKYLRTQRAYYSHDLDYEQDTAHTPPGIYLGDLKNMENEVILHESVSTDY